MKNCLACLQPLSDENANYHQKCLDDFWQKDTPVLQLGFALSELEELAKENISQRIIVPGVQPKLSLGFTEATGNKRLTIVGALNGRYILKPLIRIILKYRKLKPYPCLWRKLAGLLQFLFS